MVDQGYFKGNKVTVIGLARSGLAAANLLFDLGSEVYVSDNQDNSSTRDFAKQLKSQKINLELGRHTPKFIQGSLLVVVSPGVPSEALPLRWATEAGVPIISEIELAAMLCPAKIIAITGTNGKTTVTTLIGKVLEAAGKNVFVCGNIGRPFTQEVSKMREGDFVSLEVSLFQLERIKSFKPAVAVILNFGRNHLDRHPALEDYLEAKKRIFMNADSRDTLVLNALDPLVKELGKCAKSNCVYFSGAQGLNPNQAACMAVTGVLGISPDIALKVFREFKGVVHRMEEVCVINRVRFINDSKSTTVDATLWALNNLDLPVILICGGREKGNDYSQVRALAAKKVKHCLLIGEAKERISRAFEGAVPVQPVETLAEAVSRAFELSLPGDCVLFSPMCKSFDMFRDYEDRGQCFKSEVLKLCAKAEAVK